MEYFMRRIFQLSVACMAAGVVSGCKSTDQFTPTTPIPDGGVRFINAVPDTGGAFGLDMRFVDIVENNAQFQIAFGNNPVAANGFTASTKIEFKPTKAGTRYFKIFLSDTLQSTASTVLNTSTLAIDPGSASVLANDTTANIATGKNYTFILWGNARGNAPAMRLTAFEDDPADPGTNVALRVINATGAAIDVRAYPAGGTLPAAPTWANVPALSVSTFVNVAPGSYNYNVQPAGGGTALFADGLAMPGTAATVDISSTPGTTIAGSAITGIVFPRSVAGSKAPQANAFKVPQLSFMWDRRPPRGCNPSLC
jgi:hypothetical protein